MNSNNLEVPSDIVLLEKNNESADVFMDSQDHTQDSDSLTAPEVTLPSYNGDDKKHKHNDRPIPSSQSNGGSENVSESSGFFDSVSTQTIANASFRMSLNQVRPQLEELTTQHGSSSPRASLEVP